MARRSQYGRSVDGILLLDKPLGMGSNEVLQEVKKAFQARKAGHTGSLDRLATGLLPICLGESTKISGFLLNADKRYRAVFKLGERTTTGDGEGEVVAVHPVPRLSERQVERILDKFRGLIKQTPPMYSALKHQGQRLYKLAHQGLEVDREPRDVHIHELRLCRLQGEMLEVEIHCSKGTYIRTLAEDIGEAWGCGGRVAELRRTGSGPYEISEALTLTAVREAKEAGFAALDALLRPMDSALYDWPAVRLPEGVAYYLRLGQPVMVPHAPTRGWVRIYSDGKELLGVGEVLDDGRIAPRRLLHTRR